MNNFSFIFQREEKKKLNIKKRWDHLSSVNAKHWTSLLQNMLHFMAIYIFMKRKYQMNYMKSLGLLQMRKFIGSCQNIYGSFLLMM